MLAGLAGLTVLALGVPIGSIVRWLLAGSSTGIDADILLPATGHLAQPGRGGGRGRPCCSRCRRRGWRCGDRGRTASLLERSTYVSSALPGIVVALALVTISIRAATPLYQTAPLLIAGYAILFLPRAVVTVRAALAQAPPVLDAVARSLGEGTVGTLRRVTLPLIAPGLGAGAALVFLAVVTELTATLLLAPLGTRTLATEFWDQSDSLAYGAAAPYAALLVALSAPATYLLTRQAQEGRPHDGTHPLRRHQGVRLHRRACGVDLHVPARTLTAVLGPSGCGKTTLLRLVAGFDEPDSGTIALAGEVVAGAGRPRPPQHRRVGYVPQEGALFPHLSVAANVGFGLPRGAALRRRVGELLELVGLSPALARAAPARAVRRPAAAGRAGPGAGPGRPSCCWTSRSRRWTRRCGTRPGGPWPAPWRRGGRPRCWSPTTRPRRSRWPTRSR